MSFATKTLRATAALAMAGGLALTSVGAASAAPAATSTPAAVTLAAAPAAAPAGVVLPKCGPWNDGAQYSYNGKIFQCKRVGIFWEWQLIRGGFGGGGGNFRF